MILGIGTDIIEVDRIRATLERYGQQFEERVFSPAEIAYCRRTPRRTAERYAARFAAKEAMSKALGTGISMGTRWRDMEVRKLPTGKPWMQLHGRLAERCIDCHIEITLTHTEALAMATVILERR
jgi:holo-[acyl-carrier protein] synthase